MNIERTFNLAEALLGQQFLMERKYQAGASLHLTLSAISQNQMRTLAIDLERELHAGAELLYRGDNDDVLIIRRSETLIRIDAAGLHDARRMTVEFVTYDLDVMGEQFPDWLIGRTQERQHPALAA